jgi:hypothetical protein
MLLNYAEKSTLSLCISSKVAIELKIDILSFQILNFIAPYTILYTGS